MNISMRQGDVLIIECDPSEAANAVPIPRDNGKAILAYGESTGHAHAILDPDVQFVTNASGSRIVISDIPFTIRHEEHAPVAVPAGSYRIVIQREYHPTTIRNVRD